MAESGKTFKSVIEKYSVPCLCETLQIFHHVDLSQFAPVNLSELLTNRRLQWRIGKRQSPDLQWESSCSYQAASVGQVIEWNSIKNCKEPTQSQKKSQDLLKACCPEHYWCYADYKYMKEVFDGMEDVLNQLKWQELGFANKTRHDSAMWIGTAGAHTLCHYDTYGYNIVIQISGSKRWVLFPPSDIDSLYPTRIPYEESTVFSEVNLGNPDFLRHERFTKASACTVVLRAGDILYVPRHWWHYVENLELSVSINLWCDLDSDAEDRLTESVTRLLMGSMAHTIPEEEDWINPTEDIASVNCIEESLKYFSKSLQEISTKAVSNRSSDGANVQQIFHRGSNPILIKPMKLVNFMANNYSKLVHTISKHQTPSSHHKGEVYAVAAVKCLTHPEVMSRLARVIQDRFKGRDCDVPSAVAAIADALSSFDSCIEPNSSCTSTKTSTTTCSSRIPKDTDSTESSADESMVFLPCTIREQSSISTMSSPNRNIEPLTTTPGRLGYYSSETDVCSSIVILSEDEVTSSESESDCFEAVPRFPLATTNEFCKFEKLLNERDSTLMNMMKFDSVDSLNGYFDVVLPTLFANSLLERCGTQSRTGALPFSNQLYDAMHEALQGNEKLKSSSETLIGRRMRLWLSALQRKTRDKQLNMAKRTANEKLNRPKAKHSHVR